MIINVTGRGTTVKDSFKEILEKKLSKFERFFEDDARTEVTVVNEGGRETVEVTIHAEGMVFRSERTTDDRIDSLDLVSDALFRLITKNKSKLKTRLRKSDFDALLLEAFEPTDDELDDEENDSDYKIVRSKQFSLKPMVVEEAILQMNMLGHSFFMFCNADTEEISVVYKRKDGNYGLIEPTPEG